jgi:hypothetical protein
LGGFRSFGSHNSNSTLAMNPSQWSVVLHLGALLSWAIVAIRRSGLQDLDGLLLVDSRAQGLGLRVRGAK